MFDPKKMGFHYPLLTTSIHQFIQLCMSFICMLIWPNLKPKHYMNPKDYR
jgi:hypothetical protein